MADDSDRTVHLLEAWYAGDRAALEVLLAENLGWMRGVVRRELQGADRAKVETVDLVQDGVVRLLRRGPAYAPQNRAQLRALLAKVLRSVHRDERDRRLALRRDAGREERLPSRVSGLAGPGAQEGPGTVLDRRAQRDRVRRALARLEEPDREVLTLRQHEDLSFEAIAERLGLDSADAARMRHNRAVQKLARLLLELRREER